MAKWSQISIQFYLKNREYWLEINNIEGNVTVYWLIILIIVKI
jgi:hypothetical protein